MKLNFIIYFLVIVSYSFAGIPINGLVAYYAFSGNCLDNSSNSNHGTSFGAVLTTDRFGTTDHAYHFNGLNQYIQIPDNNNLSINTTGKMSISVWVKCDTLNFSVNTKGYVHWMGKGEGEQHEWTFRIYNKSEYKSNRMSCYAYNLIGDLGAGSYVEEPLTVGQWMHFVAIYDFPNNRIEIFKNGESKDDDTFTSYSITPENGTSPMRVGTRDFNSFFKGAIDDIRVYNRILTQTEIMELYKEYNPKTGNYIAEVDQIKVYPNPALQKIIINFNPQCHSNYNIEIVDVFGFVVKKNTDSNCVNEHIEIDVSKLKSGIYFIVLKSLNSSYSTKFVIAN